MTIITLLCTHEEQIHLIKEINLQYNTGAYLVSPAGLYAYNPCHGRVTVVPCTVGPSYLLRNTPSRTKVLQTPWPPSPRLQTFVTIYLYAPSYPCVLTISRFKKRETNKILLSSKPQFCSPLFSHPRLPLLERVYHASQLLYSVSFLGTYNIGTVTIPYVGINLQSLR